MRPLRDSTRAQNERRGSYLYSKSTLPAWIPASHLDRLVVLRRISAEHVENDPFVASQNLASCLKLPRSCHETRDTTQVQCLF